jgi:hypothetical protein
MSNPMKRRKLHRAALAAGEEVKETPVPTPVAAPVATEAVEEAPRARRGRFRRTQSEESE